MTRFVSAHAITQSFDWDTAIAAVRASYACLGDERLAPRRVIAQGRGARLRSLSAISPNGRTMGTKIISASRTKTATYLIALFDQESGMLRCLMDGNEITSARTAATSAVALDLLAPAGPVRLAVLGSGAEAGAHVAAVARVRPIASLAVYSPTPANREKFAAGCSALLGLPCHAAGSPAEAVGGADVVVAAARSHDETPILRGAWLRPGMTVVSIGSTVPEQREIDAETVRRADRIFSDVVDETAGETGDMIAARAAGIVFGDKMYSLADLAAGRVGGRGAPGEILLFKSVGSGLQDIAVAEAIADRADELGLAVPIDAQLEMKQLSKPVRDAGTRA